MSLEAWGWDDDWAARRAEVGSERGTPARVVGQDRDRWVVRAEDGQHVARIVPSTADGPAPVVGDWTLVEPGPSPSDPRSFVAVLPRRTAVSRGAVHTGATEQVLAANVDAVWIVHGLDAPLNLRRIERYLALAWQSGATPSVVLTKSDLAEDVSGAVAEVGRVALGVDVRAVSSLDASAVAGLGGSLEPGITVVLIGPSGAGKSTLVNLLADDDVAETGAVREADRKGRHTTSRRELFAIPGGALMLDTPGLREMRIWELDEGLDLAFPDIDELSLECRFRDCAHDGEPGCAVLEAVRDGRLDQERLDGFRKLRAEAAYQARKTDPLARAAAEAEHKAAMKSLRHHPKYRGRR